MSKMNNVALYSREGIEHSKYYVRAILYKLLSLGSNISVIYSDNMPDDYTNGVLVKPTQEIFNDVDALRIVYVCHGNLIYAEEIQKMLLDAGYEDVRLPSSIGMEKSPDKLRALEFNLNIGCSLNCFYCPQKVLINSYLSTTTDKDKLHLSLDEFKFIVDERINPGGSVGFSGMSEPFENRDAVEMICYAYKTGHPVLLNTTLMGLSLEEFEQLSEQVARFEKILLHIPDKEGHSHFNICDEYKEILQRFIEKYHANIAFYSCHGTIKEDIFGIIQGQNIPVSGSDKFTDRAGNLDHVTTGIISRAPQGTKIVCRVGGVSQIHVPVVMPDGRLALCCNDYSPQWNIGNIIEESWGVISEGNGWQAFLDGLDAPNSSRCWICATAAERSFAVRNIYPDWYVYGDNFLRLKKALAKNASIPILERVKKAKYLCIYGLGKFFRDSYYASYWHTILKADMFSDGNDQLYGTTIMGIPVIPKNRLAEYDGLLVIIYVKNDVEIRHDLRSCGVENIINIADVMEALG